MINFDDLPNEIKNIIFKKRFEIMKAEKYKWIFSNLVLTLVNWYYFNRFF